MRQTRQFNLDDRAAARPRLNMKRSMQVFHSLFHPKQAHSFFSFRHETLPVILNCQMQRFFILP